jgi:hypothetical protein
MKKQCNKCKEFKDSIEFHKRNYSLDGLQATCKLCAKTTRGTNYNSINIKRREWRQKNLEKCRAYDRKKNAERIEDRKLWRKKNKSKLTIYYREKSRRLRKNIQIRIRDNLATRIRAALSGRVKKSINTQELIGCSVTELKLHLEKKFKTGMSWENYGKWHIDHIRPCCSFNLGDIQQQKECFHYSNLQPLWALENSRKIKEDKKLKFLSHKSKKTVNNND